MARIAEDLLLLLLDNAEAQPRLDRSRLQRVLPRRWSAIWPSNAGYALPCPVKR